MALLDGSSREAAIRLGMRARTLGIGISVGDVLLDSDDGKVADYRDTRTALGLLVEVQERFKLDAPPMPTYLRALNKWRWQNGDTRWVPESVVFSDDLDSMAEACLVVLEATCSGPDNGLLSY